MDTEIEPVCLQSPLNPRGMCKRGASLEAGCSKKKKSLGTDKILFSRTVDSLSATNKKKKIYPRNYTNYTKKKILNTELHRGEEEFHRVLREELSHELTRIKTNYTN